MPESQKGTGQLSSHEYIFLFAKQGRYYYDIEALRTPAKESSVDRINQPNFDNQQGGPKDPKAGNRSHRKVLENLKAKVDKQRGHSRRHAGVQATGPLTSITTDWDHE